MRSLFTLPDVNHSPKVMNVGPLIACCFLVPNCWVILLNLGFLIDTDGVSVTRCECLI